MMFVRHSRSKIIYCHVSLHHNIKDWESYLKFAHEKNAEDSWILRSHDKSLKIW